MKLFIFGAGASKGSTDKSADHHILQAPLANELLDPIFRPYAEALDLNIDVLRKKFEKYKENAQKDDKVVSLEFWMTELWHQAHKGGEGLTSEVTTSYRGFLGRFAHYLRWMFQSISQESYNADLYRQLLVKLHEEGENFVEHAYINFNYDTLFDIAYDDIWGSTLVDLDSYTSQNILKPHGSINWFAQKRNNDGGIPSKHNDNDEKNRYLVASKNLFNGSPLLLNDYRSYNPKSTLLKSPMFINSEDFHGDYFQPLIFLPLLEKMLEHIPELTQKIEQAAREILPKVDEVYLVGYQANDNLIHDWIDKYFSRATINVISSNLKTADYIMSGMMARHSAKIFQGKVIFDPEGGNGFKYFVENYDKGIL